MATTDLDAPLFPKAKGYFTLTALKYKTFHSYMSVYRCDSKATCTVECKTGRGIIAHMCGYLIPLVFSQVHILTLCGGDGMSLWEGEGSSFLLCCLNFSSSSSDFTNVVTCNVIYTLSKMAKMETIIASTIETAFTINGYIIPTVLRYTIHSYVGVSILCICISGSHIYNKAIHTVEDGQIRGMKTNLIHS